MSGIAVMGNAILDNYKVIDSYPQASSLTTVRSVERAPGGLLCNCAMGLARLDQSLRIPVVGVVGNDEAGDYLAAELGSRPGIDTSQLRHRGQTSFTDVMEDPRSKTRTFFQFRGANALLDVDDVDFEELDADLLHVGYLLLLDGLDAPDPLFGTRMARLLSRAKDHGLRTSIDMVSEQSDRFRTVVPPALRFADICVINELEASRTTGIDLVGSGSVSESSFREAAEALFGLGVGSWVVIHWIGGAVGLSREGEWVALPVVDLPPGQIVTTTGAGDAFASGVLHAAWSGKDLSDAVETGIGAAACSLQAGNSTDGIRPAAEVLAYYRQAQKREMWVAS